MSVIDTGTEQVISVSYGAACETGDVITIEKGSKFAFTNYNVYVLDRTWKFTYNGATWEGMAETSVLSASGANSYLQPILIYKLSIAYHIPFVNKKMRIILEYF